MLQNFTRFAVATTVFLLMDMAIAQETPIFPPSRVAPIPQRPSDTLQQTQPAPPLLDLPTNSSPFDPASPQSEDIIVVSKFNFVGHTVFTDAQLAEVTQSFLHRPITITELVEVRSRITDLYVRSGFTTSGAFVPTQGNERIDNASAVVTIQIIEGGIEEIEFVGTANLDQYVRSRLAGVTAPINQIELVESLRLLQIDPLVKSLSASLSSGSRPGLSVLLIEAIGQANFQMDIGVSNRRVPSVGSNQAEAQFNASNLLSLGERFTVGTDLSEGSNSFNIGLAVPVNTDNGTISFSYAQVDAQIIEEPLDDFDIQSDSRFYELSFQQPIFRRIDDRVVEKVLVGISATRLESETTLFGFPFAISRGADENGETRITELGTIQQYIRQDADSALLLQSRLSVGLDAFDATVGSEPDAQYVVWRGQTSWLHNISNGRQLLLSGDLQLTGDQLVPLSQFSLGGPSSIKGYRQDALISDSGVSLNAELAILVAEPSSQQQVSVIPFVGIGFGWNNGPERSIDESFLASLGVGAQYEWNNFTARGNYAVPLSDIGLSGDSLQENGFDFELRYQSRF